MVTFSALRAICAGIHRSLVNSPHKGQWRGALMFSLMCARINGWVNNGETGDLRRYLAHYDVIVMQVVVIIFILHFSSPWALLPRWLLRLPGISWTPWNEGRARNALHARTSRSSRTTRSPWSMLHGWYGWDGKLSSALQWRHNGHNGVLNQKPHDCLLSRLFRSRSKKISKLRVTGLCARISPMTGEFPAQRASNAESVST